jgi:ATPase subunit of ABC transporter with duplicated ATPase domains
MRGSICGCAARNAGACSGANGAGKSTLLKLVAGATEPDQGTVTLGSSVRMGYFAQHSMDLLDGDDTVFESLTSHSRRPGKGSLRSLAGCFGFSGDDVEKPCRVLSGGEKARLVMAKMLFDPPNFWFSTNQRTIWIWRRRKC